MEAKTASGGQFRKKPVVIEAMRFDGENHYAIHEHFVAPNSETVFSFRVDEPKMRIHTMEGVMTADAGDWIIKGVKGEFCPCKPDIFEATYSPASEIAPDTAKEQAGRKMFEALVDIVEQFERARMRVPADLSDSIRIFGKQALAAGREAGWGQ